MTRSARSLLALLAPVASMLLTGCVDQVDRASAPDAPDALDSSEKTPPSLAFDDGSALPEDGVTLGLVRPETLRPADLVMVDQGSVILADLLYDGLTEAAGVSGTLRPALALAWAPSEEAAVWTFSIDTERITARAVAAHFERLLAEDAGPAVASLLGTVESVQVVESAAGDQVRFVLDRPDAGFPWLVSGVSLSVTGANGEPTGLHRIEAPPGSDGVDGGAVDAAVGGVASTEVGGDGTALGQDADAVTALLGSSDEVVLASTVEHRPDVVVRWYKSEREAYNGLTLAQVDAVVAPPDALGDAANRFGEQPQARAITRFYGMDTAGALAETRLRAAVLQGIDREAVADEAFAAPMFAADGVLAPVLAGYHLGGCGGPCRFDAAAARAAVAEVTAGTGAAPELTIAVVGEDEVVTAGRLASELDRLGFVTTVEVLAPEELMAAIGDGGVDLFALDWAAGAGSLDAVVPQLFGSGSADNALRFRSADVDELLARAGNTIDDATRWDLLSEAHDLAMAEGRVLPLAVAKSHLVAAPQASSLVQRADGSLELELEPGAGAR